MLNDLAKLTPATHVQRRGRFFSLCRQRSLAVELQRVKHEASRKAPTDMTTTLQKLLGETPKAQFVAETLFRQPLSRAGAAEFLRAAGLRETLAEIAQCESADLLVVRRGEQVTQRVDDLFALIGEGYTVLVRHAEQHSAELKRIADDFARDFAAPVNIHLYATPPGEWGFPWHYDAEEVFIVQTAGRKEYSLRKNTVNPWPLEETLPDDMHYEREIMPLLRVELAAGDWLYIPGGWWHKAETKGDDVALSLAIGVMPRTAIDVLDALRTKLLDSMLWRQRLPIMGDAGEQLDPTQLHELLKLLGDDLRRELEREALAADLEQQFRTTSGRKRNDV
jgi:ribosomal protein L16 Arg81 hydroxylase